MAVSMGAADFGPQPLRVSGLAERHGRAMRVVAVVLAAALAALGLAANWPVRAEAGVDAARIVPAAPGVALAAQGLAVVHTVRPGDTLWDLAVAVAPEGSDPRLTVDEIMRLSGRTDSLLEIGERLYLPLPADGPGRP